MAFVLRYFIYVNNVDDSHFQTHILSCDMSFGDLLSIANK